MPCALKPSILQHGFLVKATRHYPLPDMTLLSGLMCKASILARQITLLQSHEHTPLAYKICKTSQDSILNHCECNILWSGQGGNLLAAAASVSWCLCSEYQRSWGVTNTVNACPWWFFPVFGFLHKLVKSSKLLMYSRDTGSPRCKAL